MTIRRWIVEHDAYGDFVIFETGGITPGGTHYSSIVAVTDKDTDWDAENAALIVAAPDLLEACQALVKSYGPSDTDDDLCAECGEKITTTPSCESCYLIEKARAAIAKASRVSAGGGGVRQ